MEKAIKLCKTEKETAHIDDIELCIASGVKGGKNIPYSIITENDNNGELLIKANTFEYNMQETKLSYRDLSENNRSMIQI